jgi:hypothetical protein
MNYIDPQNEIAVKNADHQAFLSFKRFCFKSKWYFLFSVSILTFLIVNIYIGRTFFQSQTEITFRGIEVPDDNEKMSGGIPVFTRMSESTNKVYQYVYSKEMFNHLLNKFNLYDHYKINSEEGNPYLKLSRILKRKIKISVTPYNTVTIQVKDKNNNTLVADMANEIVLQLNELNKKFVKDYMQKRIELYETISRDLYSTTQNEIGTLSESLKNIQALITPLNNNRYPEIAKAGMQLDNFNNKLNDYAQNLVQLNYFSKLTYGKLQNDNITQFVVLQDALPDDGSSNVPLFLVITGALVVAFFIVLFLFYVLQLGNPYLKLLFH